jgi:5-methylcytosine-specific restriction endonuclease McrA
MEHREAWTETQRRYVERRREDVLNWHRRSRERRKQDPAYVERLRHESREYHRANPEKRSIREGRRLARIAGCAINDFTARQWKALIEAHGGRCAYCGTRMMKLQKEHVIPLLHGGNQTARNIVPSCGPCNLKKHHAGMGSPFPFLIIPTRFVG